VRRSLSLLCVVVLVCAGCFKKASFQNAASFSEAMDEGRVVQNYSLFGQEAKLLSPLSMAGGTVLAASRYVAVHHKIEIVESGSGLAKSVEGVVAFCGTIQCEVLSTNISGTAPNATPSGNVSLRVVPQDLNRLLDFIASQGQISQHSTQTVDKTAEVIDVEAKLKNQTDFRDNLRKMLAKPGVTVADLLQIQEKLTEAQAELDGEAMQRKTLANETEKVSVYAEFHAEAHENRRSMFTPIGEALKQSGEVLGDSLGALITAVAAVIPWLIILLPGGWLIVKAWKRRREKKSKPAKTSTDSHG
jgi:hypothetical protein